MDIFSLKAFRDVLGDNYLPTDYQKSELERFIKKYGNRNHNAFKRVVWFIKYDLDDYIGRYEKSKALGSSQTEESLKVRYGDIEGKIRWDSYVARQSLTNTYDYKKEKYNWTRDEFNKYNKSRSVTSENLVKKYGEVEGLKKWNDYVDRQRYTNTLDYFVEKYKDKGTELFLQYNHDKGSSRRYSSLLDKGLTHDEIMRKLNHTFNVSNIEKLFIDDLYNDLGFDLRYSYKTTQYCIYDSDNKRPYFYDICDTTHMVIIEFNGDLWHANPAKYKADDIIPVINKPASDVWRFDNRKISLAINRGFRILKVWESDYILNKNKTISETVNWLKQK